MSTKIQEFINCVNDGPTQRVLQAIFETLDTEIDALRTLANELRTDAATNKTVIDEVVGTVDDLITLDARDMVLPLGAVAGLGVDASAQDIQTANTIYIQHNGLHFSAAAVAALDISASGSCKGDTIVQDKHGVGFVFMNTAGGLDIETDKTAQSYATAIEAWASYSIATNTLPPAVDDVCIGAVHVEEGDSGVFTWGDDSITDETEAYHDFAGLPGIEVALASFALDTDAATFTYGTCKARLGTGTRVAATGKANAVLQAGTVATAKVGAWLFYLLADDSEIAVPLGVAYATLAAAQVGVRDHTPNPMLALAGVIYITNASGASFIGGTTKLDKSGITATFTKIGPAGNHMEVGRAALGQRLQVIQNASAATTTAPAAVESLTS